MFGRGIFSARSSNALKYVRSRLSIWGLALESRCAVRWRNALSISFRMTADGSFGGLAASAPVRFTALSARRLMPRKRSPRTKAAKCSSTVGMAVFGNATIAETTRSCLPRRKLFAFSVVEVSQPLIRQGYEIVIAGFTCQIAYFLKILPRFVYSAQFALRAPSVEIGFGKIRF